MKNKRFRQQTCLGFSCAVWPNYSFWLGRVVVVDNDDDNVFTSKKFSNILTYFDFRINWLALTYVHSHSILLDSSQLTLLASQWDRPTKLPTFFRANTHIYSIRIIYAWHLCLRLVFFAALFVTVTLWQLEKKLRLTVDSGLRVFIEFFFKGTICEIK